MDDVDVSGISAANALTFRRACVAKCYRFLRMRIVESYYVGCKCRSASVDGERTDGIERPAAERAGRD